MPHGQYLAGQSPGPWFNIKISSYQYRKSHCGDKTVVRSSYLHNGISWKSPNPSNYWHPYERKQLSQIAVVQWHMFGLQGRGVGIAYVSQIDPCRTPFSTGKLHDFIIGSQNLVIIGYIAHLSVLIIKWAYCGYLLHCRLFNDGYWSFRYIIGSTISAVSPKPYYCYINSSVQDCSIIIANTPQILQSYT